MLLVRGRCFCVKYILSQKRNGTYIDYSANVHYICLLIMKYEFVVRMENSVDPDQLASDEAS